jgi:hypothetical protein
MNSISNGKVTAASDSRHYLNHFNKIGPAADHYATFACTTFLYVSAFSSAARENLTQVFRSVEHNVIFQCGWGGHAPHIAQQPLYMLQGLCLTH